MKRFPSRRHRLTSAQQYWGLRNSRLCAGTGVLHRDTLSWRFTAQPTPLSRSYHLRILYHLGSRPDAIVDDPDLAALAGGRRLPHVYEQEPPRLCLYLPGQWSSSMRLVDTIVPWSLLWLFYFEEWLETDAWRGGGMHPGEKDDTGEADPID